MKDLEKGKSWPIVVRNLDRRVGETKIYKKLDRILNYILIVVIIILTSYTL